LEQTLPWSGLFFAGYARIFSYEKPSFLVEKYLVERKSSDKIFHKRAG